IGIFDPDEILPVDWGAVLPLFGQLGMQSARFGGSAYATANNAAFQGRYIQKLLVEREQQLESASNTDHANAITAKFEVPLARAMEKTHSLVRDAADTFEDALKSAPRWLQKEKIDLEGLESPLAKRLIPQIEKSRKAPLGTLGRKIGQHLSRFSLWLNPA